MQALSCAVVQDSPLTERDSVCLPPPHSATSALSRPHQLCCLTSYRNRSWYDSVVRLRAGALLLLLLLLLLLAVLPVPLLLLLFAVLLPLALPCTATHSTVSAPVTGWCKPAAGQH